MAQSVILIPSDSSDNTMMNVPLPIYPNFAVNPMQLLHRCSSRIKKKQRTALKKKKSNSKSLEEITKESFDAIVKVPKSSSWVKSHLLGKGSYGCVHLATSSDVRDKSLVAIKSADLPRASSLMDEWRILSRLSSPFVVRCFGHEIACEKTVSGYCERRTYNLILEYCSGKSLTDLIETNGTGLHESDVKVFVRDILFGLHHIHRNKVIHCDIKPDNILLTPVIHPSRPMGFSAKIADFGLAMEKGSTEYGNGSGHWRGTTRYMAPELISHGIVDYGVDIWALGCTVLEMLTGQTVWEEYTGLGKDDWINLIGRSSLIPDIPDWLSGEAQDFLRRCLVKDPSLRWGLGPLMNHPFFYLDLDEEDDCVYD